MTTVEAVLELFAPVDRPGKDLVWFADQLLAIAQHADYFEISRPVQQNGERMLVGRFNSPTAELIPLPERFNRLYRPLLARIAVIGAAETGGEFMPYGGQFTLTRAGRVGGVRLDVTFCNTPAEQSLRIVRVPIPRPAVAITPPAVATVP